MATLKINGEAFEGYYISPEPGKPLVLLIHDWDGLTDYEMRRADMLAALGYTAGPGRSAVEEFRAEWVTHASEVRRLHAKLLYRPLLESVARVPAESLRMTPQAARRRLEVLGFADPAGALNESAGSAFSPSINDSGNPSIPGNTASIQ